MEKIAVIGAGTMGNGIAHTFAQFGYPVFLVDVSEASLEKGLATIVKNLDRQVAKAQITEDQKAETLARITAKTQIDETLADVVLVIEAASENFEIKASVFKQLDSVCNPSFIRATLFVILRVTNSMPRFSPSWLNKTPQDACIP